MSRSETQFRPDVEGLRGLAVLLVIGFHAGLATTGGFVGVDVFFVISGFLITGLLLRELETSGRIDLPGFYARRIRRILPAAAVLLVVTVAAVWILIDPLDRSNLELDGAAAALTVANVRFAISAGDYFAAVASPSPFLHFWSLGVEEQFYFVWPALLLVAGRVLGPRLGVRRAAVLVLGAVIALSLAADLVVTQVAVNWAFYSLPTRAFELGLGGFVAVLGGRIASVPRPAAAVAGLGGLAAIAAASLLYDPSLAYPGAYAIVPTLGAVAVIAAGPDAAAGRLLALRPIRWMGRISYSVYLWHWPILVLAPLALGVATLAPAQVALAVAASIAAGALSWRFIEEPFRRGIRPATTRARRTVLAGLAAAVAVAMASTGLAAHSLDGLDTSGAGGDSGSVGAVATTVPLPTFPPVVVWLPSVPPVASAPPSAGTGPSPSATAGSTPEPTPLIAHGRLPAGIRPSLAAARLDREILWDDGCLGFEPATAPNSRCVFGDRAGTFTIALVGDSHASDLFPAFQAVALAHGARLIPLVKVACPFVDIRMDDPILKREYTECETWNANVLARIAALKPDLTVVAMSHWIYPTRAADSSTAAIGASIGRMLQRIPGRTVLMVDTPHANVDVPACLSGHLSNVDACATPQRSAMSGHGAIERVAAAAADVPLLDLAADVCPANPCPPIIDRMIVFRDSHHLTATFAAALAPVLDRGLAPYLPDQDGPGGP